MDDKSDDTLAPAPWPTPRQQRSSTRHKQAQQITGYLRTYAATLYPDCFQNLNEDGTVHPNQIIDCLTRKDMEGFVPWFLEEARKRRWCRSSLGSTRAILVSFLQGLVSPEQLQALRSYRPDTVHRYGCHAASFRARTVQEDTLQALFRMLEERGSPAAILTLLWLRAGLASGLRPQEWFSATWIPIGDGGILCVRTAKAHAFLQRSNGAWRHLLFLGAGNRTRCQDVEAFLAALQKLYDERSGGRPSQRVFHLAMRSCQCVLLRCNARLRDERPLSMQEPNINLYSMRHLFAARIKQKVEASGTDRRFLAALMGHACGDSPWNFYAPALQEALGGDMPIPLSVETARVRSSRRQDRAAQPVSAPLSAKDQTAQASQTARTSASDAAPAPAQATSSGAGTSAVQPGPAESLSA